ncbi:hypothetical protein H0H93_012729 [Arthromyces matolae]|nr:hypothetical protein H0H93_012729 [Arthromyces matolae]
MKAICSADALQASTHLSYMAEVGLLLIILGGGFRAHSQRTLGKYFTWEVSLKEDHKLCTIGPYSIVRHPGYLGLWVMRVGLNVYQSAGGSVVAECIRPRYPLVVGFFLWVNYLTTPALIVWMYRRAALEDELMEKEFGVVWRKWAEKTPYRIVPYIY